MKRRFVLPYNLQFFAEPGGEGNTGGNEGTDNQDNSGADQKDKSDRSEVTFTQSQVNAMMAKEKREGKNSVLKNLGFKTEKEAQDALKLFNALMDSQKSTEDKANEDKSKAETEKTEAEKRAALAEAKLTLFTEGVNKDSIDDVMAIASAKVADGKDFAAVVQEMKKDKRYSSFFQTQDDSGSGNSGSGTGNPIKNSGSGTGGAGGEQSKSYGQQLAEKSVKQSRKSSFF